MLPKIGQVDFVLSKFSLAEASQLEDIFDICDEFINDFLEDKFENLKKTIDLK